MQYALVNTKGAYNELYKLYDSLEQAERKRKKSFSDGGVILEIPQISAGLKLYRRDNSYYGTIIKETKSLFLINNTETPELIDTPIMKENMINKWFVREFFKDGIEEYDERFIMNTYKYEDNEAEEIMDGLANNKTDNESEE